MRFLLTLALATSAGAPPRAPQAEFEDVLAKVETLMDVGRWAPAKRLLLEELEQRAGDEEVIAHLADVREVLLRCSFGAVHRPVEPADVVAGELASYQPARGELHLRYRPERGRAPADFLEPDPGQSVWLHPLQWNGPFTIRVTGSSTRDSLGVIACTDEAGGYVVQADAFLALVRIRDGQENELVGQPVAIDGSAPYRLEVRVDTRNLEVFLDGARRFAVAKPGDMFGFCGLTSFAGVESIELEGRAELAWIQNQVDDASARARIEYERTYDPKADLPRWLAPYDLSDAPDEEPDPFAGFPDAPEGVLARARTLIEWEDHAAGLELAESLSDEEAGPQLQAWMRGLFLLRLGRRSEALEAIETSLAASRDDLSTRRVHALLVGQERGRGPGLAAARALIADFPDAPGPYEDLARTLLFNARKQEVAAVLASAAEAGVRSRDLQLIEAVLARAARGPSWSRTHEYTSRHYVVRSDISRELCLEAAQELDGAHRMFEMRLGRIEGERDQRLPVYLFSGQGSYHLYTRDLVGALPVHTAGVYSPAMQQLLIWNVPRRADMLRTVRHEGFHQFLDRRVGAAPTWMHEGLAEYFSSSRLERGRWAHGDPIEHHLATLRRPGFEWTPLEDLLALEPEEFYEKTGRYYAEAWHWVHFLENTGVQNGRRIRALVDALAAGKSERAALEAAFPARELPALDRARRAHLTTP